MQEDSSPGTGYLSTAGPLVRDKSYGPGAHNTTGSPEHPSPPCSGTLAPLVSPELQALSCLSEAHKAVAEKNKGKARSEWYLCPLTLLDTSI